jgi:hypothetical protein
MTSPESEVAPKLPDDVDTLQKLLRSTLKEREDLRAEAKQLQSKYKEHKKKGEALQEEVKKVTTDLAKEQVASTNAQTQLQTSQAQNTELQHQLTQLQQQVKQLQQRVIQGSQPNAEGDAGGMSESVQRALADPRTRAAVLEATSSATTELQLQLQRAVGLTQQMVAERDSMATQCAAIGIELRQAQEQLVQLRLEDANLSARYDALLARHTSMEHQIQAQTALALEWFSKCATIRLERDVLLNDLDLARAMADGQQVTPLYLRQQQLQQQQYTGRDLHRSPAFWPPAPFPRLLPSPASMSVGTSGSDAPAAAGGGGLQPPANVGARQSYIESGITAGGAVSVSSGPSTPGNENPAQRIMSPGVEHMGVATHKRVAAALAPTPQRQVSNEEGGEHRAIKRSKFDMTSPSTSATWSSPPVGVFNMFHPPILQVPSSGHASPIPFAAVGANNSLAAGVHSTPTSLSGTPSGAFKRASSRLSPVVMDHGGDRVQQELLAKSNPPGVTPTVYRAQ